MFSDPIRATQSLLSSFMVCYISKGSHFWYLTCYNMLEHAPDSTYKMLEGDWNGNDPTQSHNLELLQAYCLRTILKPVLKEWIFQWNAYHIWKSYHKNGLRNVYDFHFASLRVFQRLQGMECKEHMASEGIFFLIMQSCPLQQWLRLPRPKIAWETKQWRVGASDNNSFLLPKPAGGQCSARGPR